MPCGNLRERIGFAILCPDLNPTNLITTYHSVRSHYPENEIVSVIPKGASPAKSSRMTLFETIRGGNTITSLIGAAMDHLQSDWRFIIVSQCYLKRDFLRKYSTFIESNRDILFPIVDNKANFVDGTLNGIMLHREAWDAAGEFSDQESLQFSKLIWATNAIENGCRFKAILGNYIF